MTKEKEHRQQTKKHWTMKEEKKTQQEMKFKEVDISEHIIQKIESLVIQMIKCVQDLPSENTQT